MREIDPLKEDEDEDEDLAMLQDKQDNPLKDREIGAFILHEDFNENNPDYNPSQEDKELHSSLTHIGKTWVTDHDFVGIMRQKEKLEQFENYFERALDSYLKGDWIGASGLFNAAKAENKEDGPTEHFCKLIEKARNAPDDWQGAYDWDQKPEPPEIQYEDLYNEEDSEGGGEM